MIRNFFSTPNIIGKLMIALLFVGGVVYAGAFDGFVVETETSSCCGGSTDASIFSSSECCDEACTCERRSCPGSGCSGCTGDPCTGCGTCSCEDFCSNLIKSRTCGTHNGVCKRNP